ncbi:MAG: hypothetical protein WB817_05765 [Terriglobales bacterium]
MSRTTTRNTLTNFLDALAAVLAGNAIYFLLMPHLPRAMRHAMFKEDWGLVVDFAICTILFVALKLGFRRTRP